MRIYLMTDMEGVAGVLSFRDWVRPESRYYEVGRELLTEEVNAAVEGFLAGGATGITVADGHGAGGIDIRRLDPRVDYMRGWPTGWPFLLNSSYDAVAWVGQHAKAGTEHAHLPHTQSPRYVDLSVNGVSIGEFGQLAMCASELGVRAIFGSGDRAFCEEAQGLVPGIETVAVKQGTAPGRGDDLDVEEYMESHTSAIHVHPHRARGAIREGAECAVRRATVDGFGLIELVPPFEGVTVFRSDGDRPGSIARESHPSSVIALMNLPSRARPL